MKTNAVRMLDKEKIAYELRTYESNEEELDAETVAKKIALPPAQVFKTLVTRGNLHGIAVACIPGSRDLDLKALALLTGDKKIELVAVKEIKALTGYIRGGVSPLGLKKPYPLYLDNTALHFPYISISAGQRGLQILLTATTLQALTNATVAVISIER